MCHSFITRSWPWPWPGSGASASTGSVMSLCTPAAWGCVLSLWCPWPWPTFDLQHELKWFLLPHLWHILPNAGHSLYVCVMLHLLQVSLMLPLCELLAPFELLFLPPFFLHVWMSWFAFIVVSWAIPLFDLWQFKYFTIISCSLVYWSSTVYITSSHLFFDWTHLFTLKCLVKWNNNSVLCTSFSASVYWHFLTRFFIHADLAYLLTCHHPCLILL